MAYIESEIIS